MPGSLFQQGTHDFVRGTWVGGGLQYYQHARPKQAARQSGRRYGRPYTSGTPVTVTEEVTSPTTFGGSQDVMIAVTWTGQVSRLLARLAMTGGSVS
jgi:hypothetical protein